MNFKKLSFSISLLLLTSFASAIDVKINRCGSKIANALNRLEVKGASNLDIIEIKIDKPVDYIFGDHKLTMAPMASKFEEKKALYRYPGIAAKVLDRFETVKLIKNMPEADLAKLLEPNVIYTYTIQDQKLSIAKSKPGRIRDYASKHMLLSADESAGELRMGGEMWTDNKGVLHYDQGSGTYKPGAEDLKRAERFFRDHLGIKNSQAHFFEPPVVEAAPSAATKNPLNLKIKAIEATQSSILQTRRLLGGFKYTVATKLKKDEVSKKLQTDVIVLRNDKGAEAQYRLKLVEDYITEDVLFDSVDGKLKKNNMSLSSRRSYNRADAEKTKMPVLNPKDSATKAVQKLGIGISSLKPEVKEKIETVAYALYKVLPDGKTSKTASLNVELVSVGKSDKTEHSVNIKTSEGKEFDNSLASSLQTHLNLN